MTHSSKVKGPYVISQKLSIWLDQILYGNLAPTCPPLPLGRFLLLIATELAGFPLAPILSGSHLQLLVPVTCYVVVVAAFHW